MVSDPTGHDAKETDSTTVETKEDVQHGAFWWIGLTVLATFACFMFPPLFFPLFIVLGIMKKMPWVIVLLAVIIGTLTNIVVRAWGF